MYRIEDYGEKGGKMKKLIIFMFALFLIESVSASEIFFDGFESGGLGGWSLGRDAGCSSSNWIAQNSSIDSNSEGWHVYGYPNCAVVNDPNINMTRTINTSGYNNITVYFYRKVDLKFATYKFRFRWFNGTNWTTAEDTTGPLTDSNYVAMSYPLSSSASNNPNFAIKFECTEFGSYYCRVDDISITATLIDSNPPQFSDYIENPVNSSSYVSNQVYRFNVTITEANIDKIWIEWQGVNYTNRNITNISNVYTFTKTNLAAGTYSYKWWANDTNGNRNNSGARDYTINKATPILNKKLNGNDNNLSIIYPQQVNASGSASAGTLVIYRDGNVISNGQNYSLSAGYYKFEFNVSGNQNYSDLSSDLYANVSKASGQVSLLLNGNQNNLMVVYPQQANISASTLYGTIAIYKNGAEITSENGFNFTRTAGYYNITAVSSGNQNYSSASITYWLNVSLDLIAPSISIILPEAKTYAYNSSLPLNYSVSDENGVDSCWYAVTNSTSTVINQTITNCNNLTFDLPRDGLYSISVYANDTRGNIGSAVRSFSVNTQLAVSLINPENNKWVNYRKIEFNYTVNTAGIVNNCSLWGNFNGIWSLNQTNSSVINITGGINKFNLNLSDGNYIWNVFCSGTYNSFALNNYTLNVDLQQPVLSITYPMNNAVFKQNVSIPFNFSVSDINLNSCWYILNNGGLNYSLSCANGDNNLSFGYAAGNYNLTILANDSANNLAYFIVYNITIEQDSVAPNLTISSPKGAQASKTGIPLTFSVSDNVDSLQELSCWYNITRTITGTIEKLNANIPCYQSTTFSVDLDNTEYVLFLTTNDRTGNMNTSSSNFTVSTSSSTTPPSSEGGGGGSFVGNATKKQTSKLEISPVSDMIVNPGENKKITLRLRNTGTSFLNGCRLKGTGENSGWISGTATIGLSVGEIKESIFNLKVPDKINSGKHNIEISVNCEETSQGISFSAEIIEKKLGIGLIDVKREGRNKIKVTYSLSELSNQEQNVDVDIIIFDSGGQKLAEIKETKNVQANSKSQFESILSIPENIGNSIGLLINANSGVASTFLQEEVILGASGVSGMAIFSTIGENSGAISIILVIIFALTAFFIFRRIGKFKKMAGLHKVKEVHYVKLSEHQKKFRK